MFYKPVAGPDPNTPTLSIQGKMNQRLKPDKGWRTAQYIPQSLLCLSLVFPGRYSATLSLLSLGWKATHTFSWILEVMLVFRFLVNTHRAVEGSVWLWHTTHSTTLLDFSYFDIWHPRLNDFSTLWFQNHLIISGLFYDVFNLVVCYLNPTIILLFNIITRIWRYLTDIDNKFNKFKSK